MPTFSKGEDRPQVCSPRSAQIPLQPAAEQGDRGQDQPVFKEANLQVSNQIINQLYSKINDPSIQDPAGKDLEPQMGTYDDMVAHAELRGPFPNSPNGSLNRLEFSARQTLHGCCALPSGPMSPRSLEPAPLHQGKTPGGLPGPPARPTRPLTYALGKIGSQTGGA